MNAEVTISAIQQATAQRFNVPLEAMTSERKSADVARPRQVAMYLATKLTRFSLPVIGRNFGGRDHTTVLHAAFRVEDLCREDADLRRQVAALLDELGTGTFQADPKLAAQHTASALSAALARMATRSPDRFMAMAEPLMRAALGLETPVSAAPKPPAAKAPVAKPGRTTRACMCCGKPFASEGSHHRLCGDCRRRSE